MAILERQAPQWVQAEEREFIKAANGLKTLQTTPRGGMRIDPEEIEGSDP